MGQVMSVVNDDVVLVGGEVLHGLFNKTGSSQVVKESAGLASIITLIGICICIPSFVLATIAVCHRGLQELQSMVHNLIQQTGQAMEYAIETMKQGLQRVDRVVQLANQLAADVTMTMGVKPTWLPSGQGTKRADYRRWTDNDNDDVESASGFELSAYQGEF